MYRFVSSYLKPRGAANSYENIDISLQTIAYIQREYVDGYIELSNPTLTDNIFITIQEFRELKLPHRLDQTFEYWLAYIKNATINGTEERPNYVTNLVKARNAIQAGYTFNLCKRTLDPNASIAIGDMNDLYLYRFGVPTETLNKRSLITVNGYMHPHVPYYDGIAVIGGGSQHKLIGDLTLGILSFANVADLQMIPITEERISRYQPGVAYSNKVVIDVGRDLRNKSVIVVIGGYPLISSPLVSIVGDEAGVITVDTRSFDVVRHVNNSVGEINLEACGVVSPDSIKGIPPLSANYLRSDLFMTKYLTLPQSFIVVVDTPTLVVEKTAVPPTGLPARHISMTEPNLPIMDSDGRLPEYWISPQNGPYVICTRNNYYKQYLYETVQQYEPDDHTRVLPVGGFEPQSLDYLKIISVRKVE